MRIVYSKQSLWSKILNNIFIFSSSKKNSSSEETAKKFIDKVANREYNPRILKKFNKEVLENNIVLTFNGELKYSNTKILLYVHGGNFVEHPNNFQLLFAMQIAKQTNSVLVVPLYELLPRGNYRKLYSFLHLVYDKILATQPKEIVFLGDSAGGGAVLSFAMQLREDSCLQPSNIVLLSPWLDLSMSNPKLYNDAKRDKMNGVDGVRYEGKCWADGDDVYSPLISPMYGTFENLGKISICFGGKGVLSSECKRFDGILNKAGINHNFLLYEKEGHDFAAYPTKEGRKAIKQIVEIINS